MQKKAQGRKEDIPSAPPEIARKLENLEKFFVLGVTGWTSFVLQSQQGAKFKLTIDTQLKCSCSPKQSIQCKHTLFVLSELFFISHNNPLMWKSSYTLQDLRYIVANRRIHNNRIEDFLRCIKAKVPARNVNVIVEEDQDEDGTVCAICHMQIVKADTSTACERVCKNKFHIECFSQWIRFQLKSESVVKCPLCRDLKTPQVIDIIRQREAEMRVNSSFIDSKFKYYCDGCTMIEIDEQNAVFKCVVCEDVTLCSSCFKANKHIRHSFIVKNNAQSAWQATDDRKEKRKLDAEQGMIRVKLPSSKTLSNFLANSIPCYFSRNTRWNISECKKLDIKMDDLECISCNDKQKAFLRKLPCGHFMHHRCLRKRIEKQLLYCKIDGCKFLHGFESVLKMQLLNSKVIEDQEQADSEEQQEERQMLSPSKSGSQRAKGERSTSSDSKKLLRKSGSKDSRNKSVRSKFRLGTLSEVQ